MSNEVYTTAQAAELLGVPINTLRSWKSRKSDLLIEGTHWVSSDNQILWTQAGIEALQSINGAMPSSADAQCSPLPDDQEPIASPLQASLTDPWQRYKPLVESIANSIAGGLIRRIDNAVMSKVKDAIALPMTSTECVTLLTELGLKPCNPELLLSGNVTALLEGKEN